MSLCYTSILVEVQAPGGANSINYQTEPESPNLFCGLTYKVEQGGHAAPEVYTAQKTIRVLFPIKRSNISRLKCFKYETITMATKRAYIYVLPLLCLFAIFQSS